MRRVEIDGAKRINSGEEVWSGGGVVGCVNGCDGRIEQFCSRVQKRGRVKKSSRVIFRAF